MTVSQDKYLISGSSDGVIIIWNLTYFGLIKTLREHSYVVTGLAVIDNESFISVSEDKKIIIWNSETLTETKSITDVNALTSVCAISDDSFVTGNIRGDLKIWSYFKEHKPIRNLHNEDKLFALVQLKNVFFASASQNGILRVWDNNFNSKEIKAHLKAVLSLNVFPNGTLISSSEDKSIKTWNTQQYILEKSIS